MWRWHWLWEHRETHYALLDGPKRTGTLVNIVDRPVRCHAGASTVVRCGPPIAIPMSVQNSYLASELRARLDIQFGSECGPFTALMGTGRRLLRSDEAPLQEHTRTDLRLLPSTPPQKRCAGRKKALVTDPWVTSAREGAGRDRQG